MAMTSSILILGLKPNPEVNFHDALIALYLLFVSIITVYCALPSGRPFDILHYLSIAQNCGFFAFLLVLIIKAQTFGSTPKCNRNAVLVLLRPFPALPTGQIVGSIITVAMIVFYSWMLVREHLPTPPKKGPERLPSSKLGPVLMAKFNLPKQTTEEEEVSKETVTNVDHAWSSPDTLNVDWRMLLRMGAVTALWTIGIVNTELLIKWSHFARDSDSRSNWQFGQDFFGAGRAGPSSSAFRTLVQGNHQLNTEKSRFFDAARHPALQGHGPATFDFRGMHQALPKQQSGSSQAQGTPMLPELQISLKNQAAMDGWAAEFLKERPSLPSLQDMSSTQREKGRHPSFHPPMDQFMRPAFAHLPMNPISQMISPANASVSEAINWEQQFMQQEHLIENALGQTASNPVPVDGDELSRTAGLLLETLKDEQNPKFQKSEFMGFMRQLRDKEMVVEDDKLIPASEAKPGMASLNATKLEGTASSTATDASLRGRINSIDTWPMKSVHFDPNLITTTINPIENVTEGMSEEDAYWEAENRDYRDYWERASSVPSTSTLPVPLMETLQQREWEQLQESWDSWEVTATGIKHTTAPHYGFQTNNPYVFDQRHASSDWLNAEGMDLSVLEREAAVLSDPSNAMAWYHLGVKQQANERELKAIQALRKALELDPSLLPAWMELAVSYTNDGNRNEAYNAIREWIDHNPKYTQAVAQWKARRSPLSTPIAGELIDCLVTMARSAPDEELDADVQIALGVLFNTTEEYAKAKDCFLAALDVRPDDYSLYNRVGATIANHGQPQDAIEYYHRALAINPSYIRARFNLGISCMSLHVRSFIPN
ncbi:hypothetical protein FRC17_003664 [Serendipita sp. 399]|nr:hypothetical protein FRC17_003664 [Serendipita sp. 399]